MKSEVSRNILLIALAVRLQRLVKHLPNNHISAERISKKSLTEAYFSDGISRSEEAARKKASRYMEEMDRIFGLRGSENSGYVMAQKFATFREMFEFWLGKISPPSESDKRLHVMLSGLIHAIDNAFTEDPISIPNLARQLKDRYGNKNIRDTKEPLSEMFDSYYIGSWLQLIEMDEETLAIDTSMDPLLLRQRPRSETGENRDISIKLARPGRIHVVFDNTISDLDQESLNRCHDIARAVKHSEVWLLNEQEYLPYILYREGKDGPVLLTLRNLTLHHFEDMAIDEIKTPRLTNRNFAPYNLDSGTWQSFCQLVE